jgi:hypothetical protein
MTQNPTKGGFRPHLIRALIILALFFAGDRLLFQLLKSGMDRYYGLDKDAVILCVGHSHTVLGIDAERLESELGVPVAKYATAGANTLDRLWMIRQFLESRPSVRAVVYDVDPRLFDAKGLSSASYTLFLPYLDNAAMSRYLRQEAEWQELVTARWVRTARFRDQTLNIALRGLLGKIENKKSGRLRLDDYQGRLERERRRRIRIDPDSRACFEETIQLLTGKGIQVFLTFMPVVDQLNDLDPPGQEAVVGIFNDIAAADPNVYFLDYNRDYEHRHELFYDLRHLNGDGNAVVTGRLIADLRRLSALAVNDSRFSTQRFTGMATSTH